MAGSSRYSRRQTRLAFTPLPSSSPAAKEYNKQIQDRAAAVSLDASPRPGKRRRVRDNELGSDLGGAQLDGVIDSIPTPTASLKQGLEGESDSEPIRSTQRRPSTQDKLTSRRESRQQQLDFAGARDADTFDSPVRHSSSAKPQSSARTSIFGSQPQQKIVNISSDESDEDLPSPAELMAKKNSKRARKSQKAEKISASSSRVTRSIQQPIAVDSESEGDDILVSSGPPKPFEDESEDGDDQMPTTVGTQRRKRTVRQASPDSFISSSPPRAVDSDSDLEVVEQPKKRGRKTDTDDEEDDEVPVTPSRRKLKRQKRHMSRQDEEDLADDLEFLGPSSDVEESARMPRNTQTAQKDARQKALNKLKWKRSTQASQPENGDEGEEEEEEDEFDELYDDEDEQAQPTSSRHIFREDENDRDFIEEEDEDTPWGIPEGIPEGVPIALTRYASMKAKELFKFAVDWMIQKKINPAFQMNDEIYDLTFRKLDDEVRGLAGSKFISSVWTPEFSIALRSRPNIAYSPIDRTSAEHFMRDTCDACNRTGHPATYQIQFQDKPYHRQTLEEVAGNGDDEDDEDEDDDDSNSDDRDADDDPGWDAQGREIAPANRIWYVGKFCMSNAQTAHALQHWRWHLNEWVVDWLDRQGYLSPEKIVERDRWSTKKRRKRANKIADRMEAEGEIKNLWASFRESVDEARDSKQGRYGRWT